MKRQRNTTQMKEQARKTEVQINEEDLGKLLEKELNIMIVKMIKNLENKMEKMQESINKDLEELIKHIEMNSTITEIKNTLPWDFFGRNDAKAETPVLWPPHAKS